MKVVYAEGRAVVLCGDSKDIAAELPPNSVDALVCDPPAGIGFMGKNWDKNKGGRDQWIAWLAEIMRAAWTVIKPGAHGLVWALPRTSHWTAIALEDAGFEVRDRVSHFFGTGFPKSLNVSKQIDKLKGFTERPIIGEKLGADRLRSQTANGARDNGNNWGNESGRDPFVRAAAAHWDDWGTALKPACEDWWLIRKPLAGTVAANILEHGTGGLNIGACRIGDSGGTKSIGEPNFKNQVYGHGMGRLQVVPAGGRWPAHIVFDEAAAAELDAQAGESKSTKGKPRSGRAGEGYGLMHTGAEYNDSGGPSRFFYVAKPSRKEKDAGLDHIKPSTGGEATGRKDGSAGTQNPRAGAGRTGGARNTHPTVKAKALMNWLIKLITPPGGLVLDPFTGSGSTGVAAVEGGWEFVGVEQNEDYATIAAARIDHAQKGTTK